MDINYATPITGFLSEHDKAQHEDSVASHTEYSSESITQV